MSSARTGGRKSGRLPDHKPGQRKAVCWSDYKNDTTTLQTSLLAKHRQDKDADRHGHRQVWCHQLQNRGHLFLLVPRGTRSNGVALRHSTRNLLSERLQSACRKWDRVSISRNEGQTVGKNDWENSHARDKGKVVKVSYGNQTIRRRQAETVRSKSVKTRNDILLPAVVGS